MDVNYKKDLELFQWGERFSWDFMLDDELEDEHLTSAYPSAFVGFDNLVIKRVTVYTNKYGKVTLSLVVVNESEENPYQMVIKIFNPTMPSTKTINQLVGLKVTHIKPICTLTNLDHNNTTVIASVIKTDDEEGKRRNYSVAEEDIVTKLLEPYTADPELIGFYGDSFAELASYPVLPTLELIKKLSGHRNFEDHLRGLMRSDDLDCQ